MSLDGITKTDISEVRKAIVLCTELEAMIQRGLACELDCQDLLTRCQEAKTRLTKVNEVFGPAYPAKSN